MVESFHAEECDEYEGVEVTVMVGDDDGRAFFGEVVSVSDVEAEDDEGEWSDDDEEEDVA